MTPQEKAAILGKGQNTDRWFARMALKSIVDSDLSDKAFRVLALIACGSWRTGSAELAFDEIAWAVGCKRRQALRVVEELEKSCYIEVTRRHNRRNVYRPVATSKKSLDVRLQKCAKCSRSAKQIGAQGWCRSCVAEANLEMRIREARMELGAGASDEQIAAHLHLQKITGPVRRVLRRMERAA